MTKSSTDKYFVGAYHGKGGFMRKFMCLVLCFSFLCSGSTMLCAGQNDTATISSLYEDEIQYEQGKVAGEREATLNAIGFSGVGGGGAIGFAVLGTYLFSPPVGIVLSSLFGGSMIFYSAQKSDIDGTMLYGHSPDWCMGYTATYRETEKKNNLMFMVIGVSAGILVGSLIATNIKK